MANEVRGLSYRSSKAAEETAARIQESLRQGEQGAKVSELPRKAGTRFLKPPEADRPHFFL